MVKQHRKPHRFKKRKPIYRNRFFWLGLLILIFLSSTFYLLFFSKIFQVKEINIAGLQQVSEEQLNLLGEGKLENKILFFPTRSIFLVNLNKIREDILKKFPQIGKINFKRKFPDTLEILIEEKKPVAIFCQAHLSFTPENFGGQADECFLLDNTGIIFEQTDQKEGFPKIIGGEPIEPLTLGKKIVEKDYLESILEFQRELGENLKIDVKEFILGEGKLTALTFEGWQIYFDLTGNISEQILNLDLVLKEKISPENRGNLQYIDLRFGNRVYFKYK